MDKVFFFTSNLGYTGAEVALFNLIKRMDNSSITVICKHRGKLAESLPPNVEFYDFESYRKTQSEKHKLVRLAYRLLGKNVFRFEAFVQSIIGGEKGIFYVNTIYFPEAVAFLVKRNMKFVVHAHELQQMLVSLSITDIRNIVEHADLIITSSHTCKKLFNVLGRKTNLEVCYPAIDLARIKANEPKDKLRAQLHISNDAFIIMMSGSVDLNKNPEGFLKLGKELRERGMNVHLIWLGIDHDSAYVHFLEKETEELGMSSYFSWIKRIENNAYYDYLNLGDCLVLPSFRESFSIVLIEALALGKPVFSFRSGGPEEIINTADIGVLIDHYSINDLADELQKLIEGKSHFKPEKAMLRANDFSVDKMYAHWASVMRSVNS